MGMKGWHWNRAGVGRNLFFCRYCDTISRLPRIENDAKDSLSLSLSLSLGFFFLLFFSLFDETRASSLWMFGSVFDRYKVPHSCWMPREKTDGAEKTLVSFISFVFNK